jgi:hypothetical protein
MCSNQLSYVATKSLRLRSGAYYADLGFCRQPFYDNKLSVWLDTKQVMVEMGLLKVNESSFGGFFS